jgi:hypothetical protein
MQKKKCATCGITKSIGNFTKNSAKKDGFSVQCKECKKIYQNRWYEQNKVEHIHNTKVGREKSRTEARQFVNEYLKNNKCVDCGETDIIVLQFDHVRGKKTNAVSKLVSMGYGLDTIKEEINKCEVRCANCHTRRTYKQFNRSCKTHP